MLLWPARVYTIVLTLCKTVLPFSVKKNFETSRILWFFWFYEESKSFSPLFFFSEATKIYLQSEHSTFLETSTSYKLKDITRSFNVKDVLRKFSFLYIIESWQGMKDAKRSRTGWIKKLFLSASFLPRIDKLLDRLKRKLKAKWNANRR